MPNPDLDEKAASESSEVSADAEPACPAEPEASEVSEASEAPEEPEASCEQPRLRRFLRTAFLAAGCVLALAGTAIVAIRTAHGFDEAPAPDLQGVAPAYLHLARSLPWPGDGETALWASGIGDLGTCGGQKPVPIASVAKVMTAYVVLKDHPLTGGQQGPDITVDRQAALEASAPDESSAPVRAGQHLSERTLLELMLVPSANNVARLLARWDAGSQAAFVAKMNAEASALGMPDTVYTDPSGLDPSTRSTAVDQLRLARTALADPTLLALTAEPDTQVPDDPDVLMNTDALLGADGVVGGKTGSTTAAGGALMWAANRRVGGADHLVMGVVLDQNSNTTPESGLASALLVSRRLIEAVD